MHSKIEKIVRDKIIHEEPYLRKSWSNDGIEALVELVTHEIDKHNDWLLDQFCETGVSSREFQSIANQARHRIEKMREDKQ